VCARNSYSFTSKISKVLAGPSSLRAPISTRLELTGRGASSELCVFTSLRDSIGTHSNIASCEHASSILSQTFRVFASQYMAPSIMAGSSRHASPTKRLMTELQTYQSDPNDALLELGPADDDVMHWNAVMKGVVGTAYEGTPKPFSLSQSRKVSWR
jgi:hypothetical protein